MTYKCAKCGMAVIVLPEKGTIPACECNATIIADMSATVVGKAEMAQKEKPQAEPKPKK